MVIHNYRLVGLAVGHLHCRKLCYRLLFLYMGPNIIVVITALLG